MVQSKPVDQNLIEDARLGESTILLGYGITIRAML